MGQRPSNSITFTFIVKSVALVFVLLAACARIYAVRVLELGSEFIYVNRLNVATDSVFHLYTISGVLKSNPLDTCVVLAND